MKKYRWSFSNDHLLDVSRQTEGDHYRQTVADAMSVITVDTKPAEGADIAVRLCDGAIVRQRNWRK